MSLIKLKRWTVIPVLAASWILGSPGVRAQDLDPSDTDAPYHEVKEDESSYTMKEELYQDLGAYLKVARDALTDTFAEARVTGGYKEHEVLVAGIRKALREGGLKHELLLFRHVLERALDVDSIYLQGRELLSVEKLEERYDSANLMLLINVYKAVDYYNLMMPEVAPQVLPLPDWVAFALDCIELFQWEVTMAPTHSGKKGIALRALGWTARALNTAGGDRRKPAVAKAIYDLMSLQAKLKNGTATVPQAQQLLLEVAGILDKLPSAPGRYTFGVEIEILQGLEQQFNYGEAKHADPEKALLTVGESLRRRSAAIEAGSSQTRELEEILAQLNERLLPPQQAVKRLQAVASGLNQIAYARAQQPTPAHGVPNAAYPKAGSAAPAPRSSIFPLIKGYLGGGPARFDSIDGEVALRIEHQIAVSPIVEDESRYKTKYYTQLSARAHLLATYQWERNSKFHVFSLLLESRGQYAFGGVPIYRFKTTLTGAGLGALGLWLAVEKKQYRMVSEQVLRFGWGPTTTIKLDNKDYVMLRAGVGKSIYSIDAKRVQAVLSRSTDVNGNPDYQSNRKVSVSVNDLSDSGVSAELAAVLRIGGFLLHLEGTGDNLDSKNATRPTRLSAAADLAIPLGKIFGGAGMIFEDDAIQVGFEATRYAFHDGGDDTNIVQAGVSYVLPW